MKNDQSAQPDPRLDFAAILALRALPRFTGGELMAAVGKLLDGTGVNATLEPDLTTLDGNAEVARVWNRPKAPPRVGLTVDGITLIVVGRDRPGFSTPELTWLDIRSWPEGRARVARARAHVEITELKATGGPSFDHNYDRAAAVTVVAAAVAKLVEASAIVWQASLCAVPAEELDSLVSDLAQGNAPVSLWLGCPERPEGDRGAATRGLYPLIGAEIEVVSQELSGDAAVDVAMELAAEILRAGETPENGATLGYDDDTEFSVRHRKGGRGRTMPAVVLTQLKHVAEPKPAAGAA